MMLFLFACTNASIDTAVYLECDTPDMGSAEVTDQSNCSEGRCLIPAGEFIMGDSNPESPDQCPPRRVSLDVFSIDEREVNRKFYQDCVDAGVCEETLYCQSPASIDNEEQLPITCVNWHQAKDYCQWVGGRLPTEAEWEKAARGPTGPLWPWGDTPPNCLVANFRYPPAYCAGGVIEVGSYAQIEGLHTEIQSSRSAYGLLDVSGNAWEWVNDWYDALYFRDANESNPLGPNTCAVDTFSERGECRYKVLRGGAFNSVQDISRATSRAFHSPENFDDNIGFRCAYD